MTSQDDTGNRPDGAEGADEVDSEEQKIAPRYAVDFDLTLNSATYFYAGSATNLSDGGFFVATHILQDIGERFEFSIRLPAQNAFVKGVGEVRWHRPKAEGPDAPAGMGIRFVELEPESEEAVADYLADRDPVRWDSG